MFVKMFNYPGYPNESMQISPVSFYGHSLGPNRHWDYYKFDAFTTPQDHFVAQNLEHVHGYPESITSCGSDEYEGQYLPVQASYVGERGVQCDLQQTPLYQENTGGGVIVHFNGKGATRAEPAFENECFYPHSWKLSDRHVPRLSDHENIHTTCGNYDAASRDSQMRFRRVGRQGHLSKMKYGKRCRRVRTRDTTGKLLVCLIMHSENMWFLTICKVLDGLTVLAYNLNS